jgi:hypothetical protein
MKKSEFFDIWLLLKLKFIPEGLLKTSLLNNWRFKSLYSSTGSSSIGRPGKLYWDFFQPIGIVESEDGQ